MSDKEGGGFWGLVLGFAAVAIAGAVFLTRSFRTSRDGGKTWEEPAKKKVQAKTGTVRKAAKSKNPGKKTKK
jgi:hypothetical protein